MASLTLVMVSFESCPSLRSNRGSTKAPIPYTFTSVWEESRKDFICSARQTVQSASDLGTNQGGGTVRWSRLGKGRSAGSAAFIRLASGGVGRIDEE